MVSSLKTKGFSLFLLLNMFMNNSPRLLEVGLFLEWNRAVPLHFTISSWFIAFLYLFSHLICCFLPSLLIIGRQITIKACLFQVNPFAFNAPLHLESRHPFIPVPTPLPFSHSVQFNSHYQFNFLPQFSTKGRRTHVSSYLSSLPVIPLWFDLTFALSE